MMPGFQPGRGMRRRAWRPCDECPTPTRCVDSVGCQIDRSGRNRDVVHMTAQEANVDGRLIVTIVGFTADCRPVYTTTLREC